MANEVALESGVPGVAELYDFTHNYIKTNNIVPKDETNWKSVFPGR